MTMARRGLLVMATAAGVFAAAAAGAQATRSGSAGSADPKGVPGPLLPNSPDPVQPLAAKPSAPLPANPTPYPPSIYPVAPTAEQDSVRNRPRPEFDPLGLDLDQLLAGGGFVRSGVAREHRSGLSSFVVFPKLDLEARYESNLFRDSSSVSDTVFVASPVLTVRSDWASHALELSTGGSIGRHADVSSEDYEDVFGEIAGKAEWYDNLDTRGFARVGRSHQARGTLSDPGDTSGVIEINTVTVGVGATWRIGDLALAGDFRVGDQDYASSATVDNDDLDRTDRELAVRASYEVDDGTSLFIQPRYYTRRFRRERDVFGLLQNNEGTEILAGVSWNASGVTFAEFGAGYLRQSFDDPALPTISGPSFNGRAIWNATDLLTVTLSINRNIEETSSPGLSGVLVTQFNSRIDYEFLYRTIISLRVDYALEEFKNDGRSDDRLNGALQVRHLLNEYLFAEFELGYEKLDSDVPGQEYKNFLSAVRLGARI